MDIKFLVLAGCLLASSPASAVWAHRPLCDAESDAANARKEDIDRCVQNISSEAVAGVKLPCSAELKALEAAHESLRKCIERQMWLGHRNIENKK